MKKSIGIIATILYILLGFVESLPFLVHGPKFVTQSSIAIIAIAIAALWSIYFFIKKRNLERGNLVFFYSALGVWLLMAVAIYLGVLLLFELDHYLYVEAVKNPKAFKFVDEF